MKIKYKYFFLKENFKIIYVIVLALPLVFVSYI